MPSDFAAAIIVWRENVDRYHGGLGAFDNSATVSTMLFGCHRWLASGGAAADPRAVSRISTIKAELEEWMQVRGLSYVG